MHYVFLIADRDRRVTRQAGADTGSHQSVPAVSSAGGCTACQQKRCQILTINAMAVRPVYILHISEQIVTCAQVLQQYRSVADYVQITKLDFDTVEDEGDIPIAALDRHYRLWFALAAC